MAEPSGRPRDLEQEVEVVPALRHEDAEWKIIQQNTFTRWVNNHLKKGGQSINKLETDFADGLRLITLAECLSHRSVGRYNKKVSFRSQRLENVSLALSFFQDKEGIKIINIDSTHIVDQNKKLILGLIWTLILHYSISMGWTAEPRDGQTEETPKLKLLNWIRGKLPHGMPLSNFTSDWNDGLALGALVNTLVPGSVPNWDTWLPEDALKNTQRAMQAAKERLGVEPLIAPEELIHPEIDDLSVMTFLSQFPTAKPIDPKQAILSYTTEIPQNELVVPSVFGEINNLEGFPTTKKPSQFSVNCTPGFKPLVTIIHESGAFLPVHVTEKSRGEFVGEFSPEAIGVHKVHLRLENPAHSIVEPQNKPYQFTALPIARLCPYKDCATVGQTLDFRVEDAYNGPVDMIIVNADGIESRIPVTEVQPGVYVCSFLPTTPGLHSINVFHKKNHLDSSPFPLRVRNSIPDCSVWGRGIADSGIRVGDTVPVNVKLSDSIQNCEPNLFNAVVKCKATGSILPTKSFILDDNTVAFNYTPTTVGDHEVQVLYDNQPVEKPHHVIVASPSTSGIKAFGPGLEGGIAEKESVFQVDSNGEPNKLSFLIEGPSKTEIECQDKGNGSALVSYTPKLPGVYKVKVLSGGEHVPDSPFVLDVKAPEPQFHPAAARVSGLEPPHFANHKVAFTVDTKRTNVDDAPQVIIYDKDHNKISFSQNEMFPGSHSIDFLPSSPGPYTVDCRLRGIALPGAPYSVDVKNPVDISKLRMYGPGVEGPVVAQEPTHFTIDAKQAGAGAVEVALIDRQEQNVDIDVLDHQDGSFTVKYTAPKPGAYQLNVVFAGEEMDPIEINVQPRVDTSGITVSGLENKAHYLGQKVKIVVYASHLKANYGGARVFILENDSQVELPVLKKEAGIYEATYVPTHVGTVTAEITYDRETVRKAPIHVIAGSDPTKVVADFEKIKELIVGKPAAFIIDTKDAGEGELSVTIGGPAECSCKISDNGDGTCSAKFVPTVPGKYVIGVKYGEDKAHVPKSPFNCRADHGFHPENVYVNSLSHEVTAEEPVFFDVNTENTKDLSVTCFVPKGQPEPVIEKHGRTHRVKIVPKGISGEAVPVQILYGDTPIKGSPFILKIARSSFPENVKILNANTDKAKVQTTEEETKIIVDTRDCGKCKSLGVDVFGPDGKTRKCDVRPGSVDGLYEVVFTPDQPGQYKVNLFLDGVQSNVDVTINAVKVEQNKPSTVTVNSSSLLSFRRPHSVETVTAVSDVPGAAEIVIRSQPDSRGQVIDEVIVVPKMVGPNTIRFFYAGKEVYKFFYECLSELKPIREEVEVYEHDYSINNNNNNQKEFTTREFKFEPDNSLSVNQLSAVVTMPSNKLDAAEIIDNHDGSILVKYTPKTAGQHELSIFQEGKQVQGTPVKFFVDSYGDGYATVYGPGLQQAVVGEPAAFTVCAKGSHAKELSVSIEGPAQSTIKIHDNKDSTVNVTWDPPCPGEYKVHVKLGNKEVKNSPFSVLVAGEGQKRSHLSVGSTSEVALNISQTELKGISASIKSPSGIEEPCFVRLIEGGRLGVSFTPRECGEHLITVKRNGKLLPKAPFKIKVGKDQVGDASKVEVSGDGKTRAICQQENELFVNTSKAGFGGLSVSVQGPSKAELQCKEVKAGLIKVVYRPSEPGVYVIAIKFADHHVKDSPLTVNCTGKGAGRVKQEISKRTEQANICLPDHEGNIYLKLANMSPIDIFARIMDPKGKTEDVEMRDQGDQFYLVKFKPHIEGTHQLSVMHKDAHVNGSPFPFTVGTFGEGGAHKVRASGAGIIRGETNSVNSFNVYSREAGPGNLTVGIEGPAKATVKFEDHKDGNCHVDYKVAVAGEYAVAVKFNDMHIPDSPFKVFIAAATGEARKLEIAQFHDNVPVGKAYTFTVLTHRAKGHLEAKVMGPNNEFETIDIVPIEEGESYALRFIPKDCGNHYIYVTLDGAPMRDSPLRLRVGAKDLSDPTALSASGEGLVSGVTGHKNEFIISSVNAGAGVLTVQVDGPSKVTLDVYELDLGYKVRFTPLAPGDYFAAVKYNGIHIPGSPFKIPVTGKELGGNGYNEASFVKIDAVAKTSKGTVAVCPEYKGEASKVVAKGAGLNKFFPGRPAVFTIDTAMAGANLLLVGVITNKGPCEEVIVKNQGNGHFTVAYRIQERVKGFIFVKYGDQEIPGSPFAIEP